MYCSVCGEGGGVMCVHVFVVMVCHLQPQLKLSWSVLQKELISQILPHLLSTYPAHCTVLQYAWHSQVLIPVDIYTLFP